mmetsp:Transcript_37237/g.78004  ORF Transcript_37237/g.78004 Transcript_37237/m.78004 type:complete len:281 (+) Transcript_37237:469-1311(+)
MRNLREEMPLRGHQHHQSAQGSRTEHHSSLRTQQLQTPSSSHAETRPSAGISGHQRNRQIHRFESSGGEDEAQPRPIRFASRLGGDPRPLPRIRPPELLHQDPRGRHQGHHQAAVRRSHTQGGARTRRRRPQKEGRAHRQGGLGLLRLGHRNGGAHPRTRQGRQRALGGGAPTIRHRRRGRAGLRRLHVRRAVLLPRRQAEAHGRSHDPTGAGAHRARRSEVRIGRGARSRRPGLSQRLRLRPLRCSGGVRRRHHALQRSRRHQRLPRGIHTHGESQVSR